MAFLRKRGKIHVENTEKPTILILKEDSILRTAFSESPITSLKLEHLSNQIIKTTLWLVRDTYPNAAIWLLRDTYLKQCDGASSIPLSVCNLDVIFFKLKKTQKCKYTIGYMFT